MSKVDERKRKALSNVIQESGISENAVLRVIEAIKNTDAIGVGLLLDLGKQDEEQPDATFEDGAPEAADELSDIGRDGTE